LFLPGRPRRPYRADLPSGQRLTSPSASARLGFGLDNRGKKVGDAEPALVAEVAAPAALREPFAVFDSFLPEADALAMRAAFDTHFSNPHRHQPATHQIWNYWYVP